MVDHTAIQTLSDTLIYEIITATGLPRTERVHRLFSRLFRRPAERLATLGATADHLIASDGFAKAAGWMLTNWCSQVTARGTETIPSQGPLLVISNHAGSYDTFVIASKLGREDLKLISSDIPFLKNLPHASEHIIFLSDATQDRMTAARAGIRHLQDGGSLLIYGTGLVDPDPAVYPDAEKHIDNWSPSIDLFLRTVPDAQVLPTIVSGVLSEKWGHHPITWLRRIDWQKRKLAEFAQVIQQLFFPGRLYLTPNVSFGHPASVEKLRQESPGKQLLPAVVARARTLLAEHCRAFQVFPGYYPDRGSDG